MQVLETHLVPEIEEKIRLQEYAVSKFESIPTRSGIKKAVKKGLILIDGKPAKTSDWIKEGQRIQLIRNQRQHKIFKLKLEVIYEDDFIAVIKKPSGYPTSGNSFKNIKNSLPFNLKPSGKSDALTTPLPAHRLDSATSGLLLCGKTFSALRNLNKQFENKEVHKTYSALVHGTYPTEKEISRPIEGKSATTITIRKRRFQIDSKEFSLVEAKPITGRTHQIRIHLSEEGFPIVGDIIYGRPEVGKLKNKSLFLFANSLSFIHPEENSEFTFSTELPKKFRNLKNLR